jgi:hypothetical protein
MNVTLKKPMKNLRDLHFLGAAVNPVAATAPDLAWDVLCWVYRSSQSREIWALQDE